MVLFLERYQIKKYLDRIWLDLLLALIGSHFEELEEYICGVVVSMRQNTAKISLWTRYARLFDVNYKIALLTKKILKLPKKMKLTYQPHETSVNRNIDYSCSFEV
mmetsp:Transcript_15366/g.17071  ORF Transcript_15366/g.17071 Transcript_15366/m.17071 type:complete len:105 (+) Transcript_15366:3-317(+)